MKSTLFAVLLAVSTLLLGGCAGTPQRQVVMVPQQQAQQVAPPQFLCNGRWQVGPCGSTQGTTIPVGQIMQAGSGIGKCELVGGGVGAVGGAVVGGKEHRGVGALIGAIVGAFAGNKYCESEQPQVQQVAVAQQQPQRRCAPGKIWAKLNWKGENGQPDHPQHGQFVCMDPSDPHKGE